jgi:hypothetical protein
MRAASSLPVLAKEVRMGQLGDPTELMAESFGATNEDNDFLDEITDDNWNLATIKELLNYDFETNDSKFSQLFELLVSKIPQEKVVIFSFYCTYGSARALDYLILCFVFVNLTALRIC